jgi:L-iditol 2-dehydrogenase
VPAAAGTQEAVDVAFAAVSVGRKLLLAGIPEDDKTSFSASVARRKGLKSLRCEITASNESLQYAQ